MSLGLHVVTILVGDLLQAYDEQTWLTILPHNMSILPKLPKCILQDSPGFLLLYCFFELFNSFASVYSLPLKDKIHGYELLSIMNEAKNSFHI